MIKQEICVSKSVESAVAQGAIALGVTVEEVQYEVLEEPKKGGFLGFGSKMAKVRVFLELPDPAPAAAPAPVQDDIASAQPEPRKSGASRQERNAPRRQNKQEKKEAPDAALLPLKTPLKGEVIDPAVAATHPSVKLLQTLISNMGLEAEVTLYAPAEGEEQQYIDIHGEGTALLIGHHGDTMAAIQYLANLASNRAAREEYPKVKVDIEGYCQRREASLCRLALRTAERAKKYRRNYALEPMNPYERRMIHSQLQGVEGISTHSVGSGSARRVIVTYEGE